MQLTFGTMTRGAGKIFIDVSLSEPLGTSHIEVSSKTKDGDPIPAVSVIAGPTEVVVVIPVLKATQEVMARVRDEQGNEIASSGQTVSHLASASASKLNTFKKDATALRIRNIDTSPFYPGSFVRINEVIRDQNEDIIHGSVEYYPAPDARQDDALEIVVLNSEGKRVNSKEWIHLSEGKRKLDLYPGTPLYVVNFSVRIPAALPSFVLWAKQVGSGVPDGFFAMQPQLLATKREDWRLFTQRVDADPRYDEWFRLNQQCGGREREMQVQYRFESNPLFSVVVPLYKTPLDFFHEMVDSVLAQTYKNFELILVDASPEDENLGRAVDAYTEVDGRVRRVNVKENLGITENTDRGIEAAKGDFLCFLDHDDIIEPDALFTYTKAINDYPTTDLLYSDEDKIRDGVYVEPFFKPDYDIDLLCEENYVCHFLCARRSVVMSMPLATSEMDGSQDHDLTLRVAEKARNVFHARKMLYHWRIHPGSTSASADDKPYAYIAGRLAVERHLERCGIPAKAVFSERLPMRYEVQYEMPNPEPKVSIIIPNKDGIQFLSRCISSIVAKSTYKNYEIVIIENNSESPETFEYYERLKATNARVKIIFYKGAFNFSAIINFGVRATSGEYVLLLNNDTEVISPNWIEHMLGPCMRQDVGAVGARLYYPDDTIQHAGVYMGSLGPDHIARFLPRSDQGYELYISLSRQTLAVTGACLLTKRSLFDKLGGLDESFEVDYNDIDYCLRLRELGFGVVYEPKAELYHYESVTRGHNVGDAKAIRFRRENGYFWVRWPKYFERGDPFFNQNLMQMPYWRLM